MLTDSINAKRYWSDLKRKLAIEAGSEQPYEKIVQLKMLAQDGKQRVTVFMNLTTDQIRIYSIPVPDLPTQRAIVTKIEAGQDFVNASRLPVRRMEAKVKVADFANTRLLYF